MGAKEDLVKTGHIMTTTGPRTYGNGAKEDLVKTGHIMTTTGLRTYGNGGQGRPGEDRSHHDHHRAEDILQCGQRKTW
jgi:hypothetical protein